MRAALDARPAVMALAAFGAAYVAAGGLSQGLAIIPGVTVTFWPPAGIFIATLLLTPTRSWPWWTAVACAAELTCNAIWFHNPAHLALLYFTANLLEALTAAALVRRFGGVPFRLDSSQGVMALGVFGAGVAPIVGATIIASIDAVIGKHDFFTAWPLVWLGDGSGILVSAPLTLVVVETWSERRTLNSGRLWEAVAVTAVLMGLGVLIISDLLHTPYVLLPALVWIALRFQLRGGAAALALTALLTAEFAAVRKLRAANVEAAMAAAVELQAFLAISALCTLLVAALSHQNRLARTALSHTNAELEQRVAERTARLAASEARLALFVRNAPAAIAMFDTAMRYVEYSARFVADYRLPRHQDLRGRSHYDVFPDVPVRWRAIHQRVLAGEELSADEDPMPRANGEVDWVRWSMKPWRSDAGTIGGALLFSEVVTDAVLARRAIEAQARRLRLAHDAAGLGSWELDLATGVPVAWSARARELIGFGPDEIPSMKRLVERTHPDDRHIVQRAVARAHEGGAEGRYYAQYRVVLPGGGVRWLEDSGQIEYDDRNRRSRLVGVVRDISEVKRHERRQQLLIDELNHRVKNTLATVQAIAMQSLGTGPGVDAFVGRLKALGIGHDVLSQARWEGAPLGDVVARAVAPYGACTVAPGPQVWLPPRQALAVTLALHELATNAVKYGALSISAGSVHIAWDATADGFQLRWQESGGPPVTEPTSRGFGSKLLERALAVDLDGHVRLDFQATGVVCTIDARTSEAAITAADAGQEGT